MMMGIIRSEERKEENNDELPLAPVQWTLVSHHGQGLAAEVSFAYLRGIWWVDHRHLGAS